MQNLVIFSFLLAISACTDPNFKATVARAPAKEKAIEPKVEKPTPPPAVVVPVENPTTTIPVQAEVTSLPTPAPKKLVDECLAAGTNLKVMEQSISYPSREECSFGIAPNLGIKDGFLQAFETSSKILNLPKGKICEISLESPKDATLHYDDMLILTIEDKVIFVNSEKLTPFLVQKDGIFDWDYKRVLGKELIDFGGKSYCIGSSQECIIPDTDMIGPVSINLPAAKIAPISIALTGKTKASINLTASGDNDPGDCAHTQLDLKVTFRYLP